MNSSIYDVQVGARTIRTTVTADPTDVNNWLFDVSYSYRFNPTVVIGLDAEGKGNCRRRSADVVATLQLCAGSRCLIIQLRHLRHIPDSLRQFLNNPRHVFAGLELASDAANLLADHGLVVGNLYDVREAALEVSPERLSTWPGLKKVAREVAGIVLEKPRHVTMSDWGRGVLTEEQVEYACCDAFASFRVGQILYFGFPWGDTDAESLPTRRITPVPRYF